MKKIILYLIALFLLTSCSQGSTDVLKKDYVIVKNDEVETEKYENDDFSITIPKGWIVESTGMNIYHTIRIYDPDDNLNQMFIILKAEPFLHSQAGKDAWKYIANIDSSASILANAPVLSNPSSEGFYKIFKEFTDYVSTNDPSYVNYHFPVFDDFEVIESFPSNTELSKYAIDDQLLRATFYDNGKEGEGLFGASIIDFGRFDITNGNVNNYQLEAVDGGYYMAYNIVAITSSKDCFIDLEPLLTNCMKTLEYSERFVNATNEASNEKVALAMQISKNFNETMDSFMASWEQRNLSFDIMSQKQSDAILGYERVYDTETNEIYKATNGFSDVYDGERYKVITDDNMYTQPVAGYIEKQ